MNNIGRLKMSARECQELKDVAVLNEVSVDPEAATCFRHPLFSFWINVAKYGNCTRIQPF